jgi:transcriptional regulator with XRE-family HTH domain
VDEEQDGRGHDLDVAGIGVRIARRRDQLGLKQLDLARRAGMSEAYVNRLENGVVRNPKVNDLGLISNALSLPLDALLYADDQWSDEGLSRLIARDPQLQAVLSNLLRGLSRATPEDQEFIKGQLEALARRFGSLS